MLFSTREGGWGAYGAPLNKYNILVRRESTPGGGATFARYTLPRLRYAQPLARSRKLAYVTVFVFPIVLGKNNNTIRPNRTSEILRARERLSVAKPRKHVASKSRASTGRTFSPNEDVIFI